MFLNSSLKSFALKTIFLSLSLFWKNYLWLSLLLVPEYRWSKLYSVFFTSRLKILNVFSFEFSLLFLLISDSILLLNDTSLIFVYVFCYSLFSCVVLVFTFTLAFSISSVVDGLFEYI